MSAPLCFLDTETTGVHPSRQVWEIGMIRREPDGWQLESQFFVQADLREADPFGLTIGRYWERHPMGQYIAKARWDGSDEDTLHATLSPAQAAELVAHYTHGAHLVGAVPSFDANTLDPLLRAHGHLPAWHYHLIDVEALMVGYLAGRIAAYSEDDSIAGADANMAWLEEVQAAIAPPWSSRDLALLAAGITQPDDEQHTALGDARWAMRIYDHILGGTA